MKQVLIADDDSAITDLMVRALPEYHVTVAHNGLEALLLGASLDECDLLITDYLMPAITGDEVAGRLRERRPAIKTLMVTGHASFVNVAAFGIDAHLSKPFRVDAFRAAVLTLMGDN
jgi:CheY-like chemotaxis protein